MLNTNDTHKSYELNLYNIDFDIFKTENYTKLVGYLTFLIDNARVQHIPTSNIRTTALMCLDLQGNLGIPAYDSNYDNNQYPIKLGQIIVERKRKSAKTWATNVLDAIKEEIADTYRSLQYADFDDLANLDPDCDCILFSAQAYIDYIVPNLGWLDFDRGVNTKMIKSDISYFAKSLLTNYDEQLFTSGYAINQIFNLLPIGNPTLEMTVLARQVIKDLGRADSKFDSTNVDELHGVGLQNLFIIANLAKDKYSYLPMRMLLLCEIIPKNNNVIFYFTNIDNFDRTINQLNETVTSCTSDSLLTAFKQGNIHVHLGAKYYQSIKQEISNLKTNYQNQILFMKIVKLLEKLLAIADD